MFRPSLRALAPSAPELIRNALIAQGPLTTQALHQTLHALPTPLPSRPPPSNFLSGVGRRLRAHQLGIAPDASLRYKRFAGEKESADGVWSVSYLKRKVLKGMEERGEVVKITRAKWVKMGGELAEATPKGKEEEHVWAVARTWEHMSKTRVKPEKVDEDEGEVRRAYGLRESRA